jgi:hypothetical protein
MAVSFGLPANRLARLVASAPAMPALRQPGGGRADHHTDDQGEKQEDEEWRINRKDLIFGPKGIESECNDLAVGHAKNDQNDAEGKQHQQVDYLLCQLGVSCFRLRASPGSVPRRLGDIKADRCRRIGKMTGSSSAL